MRRLRLLRRSASIWGRVLVLVAAFWAVTAAAQEGRRLLLDPSHAPFDLAAHADYLIEHGTSGDDWAMRMQLPDLITLDDRAFAQVETRKIGFGWQQSIVHIRVPIENPTMTAQDWVLSFNQTKWGHRKVYLVIAGEPLPSDPIFLYGPEAPWLSSDRIVHTPLHLPANTRATLYVSYENLASSAPMTLEVPSDYEGRRLLEDFWIYILIGLVVGITALTVSLIGVLQSNVAIYYAGYIVTATIHFCFILDLFHPSPLLSSLSQPFASFFAWAAISSVFYMLFQYAFLAGDSAFSDTYRKAFLGAAGINGILLTGHTALGMPLIFYILWSQICLVLISANGVIALLRRITGGIFFAFGCFTLALTTVPLVISDFMTAHYSYEEVAMFALYGIAIEAITLAAAMFSKVRKINAERTNALQAELDLTRDRLNAIRRLATAAHDIQQPLTSLRMALADESDGTAKSHDIGDAIDYLDEIVRAQMAEAKSDLTTDEDPDTRHTEDFDLSFVLETLRSMFEQEAVSKGLSFRVAPTDLRVTTDPLALTRILSNLVTNAIRNTERGGILIGGRRRGLDVRIDVTDTGSGLPGETLADLQKPYTRHGDYDGQGLGLSSVRHLCKEHGIQIGCTSQRGRGTTFHITVPRAAPIARLSNQTNQKPTH